MNLLSLTVLVFLPLVGALLVAATPSKAVGLQRAITLVTMLVVAVIGVMICLDFDGASAASQHAEDLPWFTLPGGIPVQHPGPLPDR